jgi:hypothetical protein
VARGGSAGEPDDDAAGGAAVGVAVDGATARGATPTAFTDVEAPALGPVTTTTLALVTVTARAAGRGSTPAEPSGADEPADGSAPTEAGDPSGGGLD